MEAQFLRHPAVVGPRGDDGPAASTGDAGDPSHQRPAARADTVMDEARPAYVAGGEDEGAGDLITAVGGLVDRVGARVEERRVHVVAVQDRPVRRRRQFHQPDRDAQRVPAARTPKALHCRSVTSHPSHGIRDVLSSAGLTQLVLDTPARRR